MAMPGAPAVEEAAAREPRGEATGDVVTGVFAFFLPHTKKTYAPISNRTAKTPPVAPPAICWREESVSIWTLIATPLRSLTFRVVEELGVAVWDKALAEAVEVERAVAVWVSSGVPGGVELEDTV